jgi:hypothetical protein
VSPGGNEQAFSGLLESAEADILSGEMARQIDDPSYESSDTRITGRQQSLESTSNQQSANYRSPSSGTGRKISLDFSAPKTDLHFHIDEELDPADPQSYSGPITNRKQSVESDQYSVASQKIFDPADPQSYSGPITNRRQSVESDQYSVASQRIFDPADPQSYSGPITNRRQSVESDQYSVASQKIFDPTDPQSRSALMTGRKQSVESDRYSVASQKIFDPTDPQSRSALITGRKQSVESDRYSVASQKIFDPTDPQSRSALMTGRKQSVESDRYSVASQKIFDSTDPQSRSALMNGRKQSVESDRYSVASDNLIEFSGVRISGRKQSLESSFSHQDAIRPGLSLAPGREISAPKADFLSPIEEDQKRFDPTDFHSQSALMNGRKQSFEPRRDSVINEASNESNIVQIAGSKQSFEPAQGPNQLRSNLVGGRTQSPDIYLTEVHSQSALMNARKQSFEPGRDSVISNASNESNTVQIAGRRQSVESTLNQQAPNRAGPSIITGRKISSGSTASRTEVLFPMDGDQRRFDAPGSHTRTQKHDNQINQAIYAQHAQTGFRPGPVVPASSMNYPYQNDPARPLYNARAPYNYRPGQPPQHIRGYPTNFQSMPRTSPASSFNQSHGYNLQTQRPRPQMMYSVSQQNQPLRNRPPGVNQSSHYVTSSRPQSSHTPGVNQSPHYVTSSRPQSSHTVRPMKDQNGPAFPAVRSLECSAKILNPIPFSIDPAEDQYSEFPSVSSILKYRANLDSKHNFAFTYTDNRLKNSDHLTYEHLHLNAVLYATYFLERAQCVPGSSVALLFKPNEHLEFLCAFFGCLYAGLIAVPIVTHSFHAGEEFSEIFFVISYSKCAVAVSGDSVNKGIQKFLAKNNSNHPSVHWIKTSEVHAFKRLEEVDLYYEPVVGDVAYLEYTKNSSGDLKGIVMSHRVVMKQCGILRNSQAILSEDVLLTCIEFRQGFGLLFGVFLGIYAGMHMVAVPNDICEVPGLWLLAVTRFRATIGLAQPVDLLAVMSSLGKYVPKKENIDLSSLKAVFIDTLSPNGHFIEEFAEVTSAFGLSGSNVITPILSLHEFGGVVVSIFPNLIAPKSYKLRTVLLDSKSAMELKVSVLSITDDIANLWEADSSRSVMQISDSGRVMRQGIPSFYLI